MHHPNRRKFLGSAAAAFAAAQYGAAAFGQSEDAETPPDAPADREHPLAVPGYHGSRPGIQIGTQLSAGASEEQMQFARQLGVEWVMTGLPPDEHTLENYRELKRRFAAAGLKIYRLGNHSCHNMEQVTLNLTGRDAKIKEYLRYILIQAAVAES